MSWEVGRNLPEVTKTVTQEQVIAYADAAHDWNPIHLDSDFAAGTQFGKRIAHGMLGLGFVSEMLSLAFPESWGQSGGLKVRFKAPIFPGETVKISGEVTNVSNVDGEETVTCSVACIKPDNTEAIVGTATVRI
ncbi:MAG: MaoC family dehydratase [Chloroflexi bacterium]|nr:MaoC family dehydratase [Chloroflexota bacterium]